MALTAVDMARSHPLQFIYFNRTLSGGFAEAAGRFELDYWGYALREGIVWLEANLHDRPDNRRYRVAQQGGVDLSIAAFMDGSRKLELRPTGSDEPADIVLTTLLPPGQVAATGRLIHRVEVRGVPVCHVFLLEGPGGRPLDARAIPAGSVGLR